MKAATASHSLQQSKNFEEINNNPSRFIGGKTHVFQKINIDKVIFKKKLYPSGKAVRSVSLVCNVDGRSEFFEVDLSFNDNNGNLSVYYDKKIVSVPITFIEKMTLKSLSKKVYPAINELFNREGTSSALIIPSGFTASNHEKNKFWNKDLVILNPTEQTPKIEFNYPDFENYAADKKNFIEKIVERKEENIEIDKIEHILRNLEIEEAISTIKNFIDSKARFPDTVVGFREESLFLREVVMYLLFGAKTISDAAKKEAMRIFFESENIFSTAEKIERMHEEHKEFIKSFSEAKKPLSYLTTVLKNKKIQFSFLNPIIEEKGKPKCFPVLIDTIDEKSLFSSNELAKIENTVILKDKNQEGILSGKNREEDIVKMHSLYSFFNSSVTNYIPRTAPLIDKSIKFSAWLVSGDAMLSYINNKNDQDQETFDHFAKITFISIEDNKKEIFVELMKYFLVKAIPTSVISKDGNIFIKIKHHNGITFGRNVEEEIANTISEKVYSLACSENLYSDTEVWDLAEKKLSNKIDSYVIESIKANAVPEINMYSFGRTNTRQNVNELTGGYQKYVQNSYNMISQQKTPKVPKGWWEEVVYSLTSVSSKEKVFPNLVETGNSLVSAEDIIKSPTQSIMYSHIDSVKNTIKKASERIGFPPPKDAGVIIDLLDPQKNDIPDSKKNIEIDKKEKNGILNLKTFPRIINISNDEAKNKFKNILARAIQRSFGIKDSDFNQIISMVDEEMSTRIDEAYYVVLKSESRIDGVDILKEEKFVLVDEFFAELEESKIEVSPFYIKEVIEEDGILTKDHTTKNAMFTPSDISILFDTFMENITKSITSEKRIFKIIKQNFAEYVSLANKKSILMFKSKGGGFVPLTEENIAKIAKENVKDRLKDVGKFLLKNKSYEKFTSLITESEMTPEEISNKIFAEIYKEKRIPSEDIKYRYKLVEAAILIQDGLKNKEIKKFTFSEKMKETGLSDAIMKFMSTKKLSSTEIVEKAFKGAYKDKRLNIAEINTKKALASFMEEIFIGREHVFLDNSTIINATMMIVKKNIIDDLPDDKKEVIVESVKDIIAEESVKDFSIQRAALSMINTVSFIAYVEKIKKEKGNITAEEKSKLMVAGLKHVFKLRDHQIKTTLGIMALYQAGKISVANIWLLMRMGKTSIALTVLVLISWLKKENSVFFVQKKNFADILDQMFRIFPPYVHQTLIAVGKNNKYNTNEAKMPLSITKWIIPNIPVLLRDIKDGSSLLLRNTQKGSRDAAAMLLASNYEKLISIFLNKSAEMTEEEKTLFIEKTKGIFDADELFMDHVPNTKEAKIINFALILYLSHIIEKGVLPSPAENNTSRKIIQKIHESFWKDYQAELNRLSNGTNGLVLIGKHFIDGYMRKESIKISEKPKTPIGATTPPIIETNKDVTLSYRSTLGLEEETVDAFMEFIDGLNLYIDDGIEEPKREEIVVPRFLYESNSQSSESKYLNMSIDAKLAMGNFSLLYIENKFATILERNEDELNEDEVEIISGFINDSILEQIGKVYKNIQKGEGQGVDRFIPFLYSDSGQAKGAAIDISATIAGIKAEIENFKKGSKYSFLSKSAKNVINEVEKSIGGMELVKTLQNSIYAYCVETIYMPRKGKINTSIKKRFDLLIGGNLSKISGGQIDILLNPGTNLIIPVKTKNIIPDTVIIDISTESLSPLNPSIIEKKRAYAAKSFLMAGKNTPYSLEIKKIIDSNNTEVTDEIKKYDVNIQTRTLWGNGPEDLSSKHIKEDLSTFPCAAMVDETHKGAKVITGVIANLSAKKPDFFTGYLTGTPVAGTNSKLENLTDFIYNDDNPYAGKIKQSIKRELVSLNGNIKIRNEIIGFFLLSEYHTEKLNEGFSEYLKSVFQAVKKDGINTNIYIETQKFYNDYFNLPENKSSFYTYLGKVGDEQFVGESLLLNEFASIAKSCIRVINAEIKSKIAEELKKNKTNKQNISKEEKIDKKEKITKMVLRDMDIGLEVVKRAVLSDRKMATPTTGISNVVNLAAMIGAYTDKTITKIGVPDSIANGMYEIIDRSSETVANREQLKVSKLSDYEKYILAFEDVVHRYRRAYSLKNTYNTIINLIELSVKGLQENSQAFGLSIEEVNRAVNKSKASTKDDIIDEIRALIVSGTPIPTHKKNIAEKIFNIFNYLTTTGKEEILKVLSEQNDNEIVSIPILDNVRMNVNIEVLKNIDFKTMISGTTHIVVPTNIFDMDKKDREDGNYITLTDKGIQKIKINDGEIVEKDTILYSTNLLVQPFSSLPPIKSKINMMYADESQIFSVIAAIPKIKDNLLKHISKGSNSRIVTTRTEASKYGLLATIQALAERKDKSVKQHVMVNTTSSSLSNFVSELDREPYKSILEKNNISLYSISVEDLEVLVDPILAKEENIHFISDMASAAEGINNDYIDIGFYIGSLKTDPNTVFQSFARQIGVRQNKSIISIYGGEGGTYNAIKVKEMSLSVEEISQFVKKGYVWGADNAASQIENNKIFSYLYDSNIKIVTPSIVKHNISTEKAVDAANRFMTGDIGMSFENKEQRIDNVLPQIKNALKIGRSSFNANAEKNAMNAKPPILIVESKSEIEDIVDLVVQKRKEVGVQRGTKVKK